MRSELADGVLTLYPEGHIDSTNAADFEREAMAAADAAQVAQIVADVNGLEYVSSAGLRVFMKLAKRIKGKLSVINASPDVYGIFEVTGFTEILDVRKRLREVSVEGCEVVGQGGNGTVYRLDEDTIVKVYKPWMELPAIQRERDFARTAFVNGVPSVIAYDVVKVDDCLGVVFEMIKSDTLGHAMRDHPEKLDEYVDKYVELAKTLHNTHVAKGTFSDIHDILHERTDKLDEWCSAEEIALLHDIVDAIPHADTLTHNDLHPGNIMVQDGELLLIDMPEVTMAPPVCDMTAIFRDMISAPQTSASVIEKSVGMPAQQIVQAGNMFFARYTGITDPAELATYFKKLGLLYAFNVTLIAGTGSENARKMADRIMNNLLRQTVVPNVETIKALYQTM